MSDNLEEETIVWYKVIRGFLTKGKIYLTHEGAHIPRWFLSDIHIPYAAITACGYFRSGSYSQKYNKDTCLIKYIDEKGKYKILRLHSCFDDVLGALKTYHSILLISRHQGYTINQQLDKILDKFIGLLKHMKVYAGFIEFAHIDLEITTPGPRKPACWKRELGTLKLKNSNIHSIKVTESGHTTIETHHSNSKYGSAHEKLVIYPKYHLDLVADVLPVIQTESYGAPIKVARTKLATFGIAIALFSFFLVFADTDFCLFGLIGIIIFLVGLFSQKFVNYDWQGGKFAERLNQDNELVEMLIRAKAPPIGIRGNHIYLEDNKFPDQMLLLSIERITEHIRVSNHN